MSLKKNVFLWTYWHPLRKFIQSIPAPVAYSLARIAGVTLYYTAQGKRKTLEDEFRTVFQDHSYDKIMRKAVKRTFVNLCQSEAEMMQYPNMNGKNIRCFVECPSFENLNKGLDAGKGAMLLFAHFGANQMVMPAVGYNGYRMSQMSAPATVWEEKLPNRRFSPMEKKGLELRWSQELSLPVKHINIFGSMKGAFQCLRKNEILGIALDGGGGSSRVEVDFLGKKAFFSTGALNIALRTKCAVLPTFMIRYSNGMNKLIIEGPIDFECDEDPIKKGTQVFAMRLEEYVKRYPCHYLNFLALRKLMEKNGDPPFLIDPNDNEITLRNAS